MNVEKLEGAKDRPNKYSLPMRLWGAVGLPKKNREGKYPVVSIHPGQHLHTSGSSGGKWV